MIVSKGSKIADKYPGKIFLPMYVKLKYWEKETELEKSPTCFGVFSLTSKQEGYFFQLFEAFLKNRNFIALLKP